MHSKGSLQCAVDIFISFIFIYFNRVIHSVTMDMYSQVPNKQTGGGENNRGGGLEMVRHNNNRGGWNNRGAAWRNRKQPFS